MNQEKFAAELHENYFKAPGKLLDIGCGPGTAMRKFKELGYEVSGVDRLHENAELGIQKLDLNKGLPFGDNSFDFAVLSFSLRFANDWQWFLREVNRVMKPGGKIAVNDTRGVCLRLLDFSPFNHLVFKRYPWYAFFPYQQFLFVGEKFKD